jgi:FkbM family methyltransferase
MFSNIRGHQFIINNLSSSWVWGNPDGWDKETFDWVEKNRGDKIFWDIGAWIGPFTIFGSRLFSKVIAFEPDKIASNVLSQHIKDNNINNVIIETRGLYKENTEVNFGFIGGKYGDSLSSINHHSPLGLKIKTLTIEEAIKQHGYPGFLKIDIEGGEEYLIDDLIKYRFEKMCMSNHGTYMKDRKIFQEKLNDLFGPLYNCYNRQGQKIENIPDDGDFYYELKKI